MGHYHNIGTPSDRNLDTGIIIITNLLHQYINIYTLVGIQLNSKYRSSPQVEGANMDCQNRQHVTFQSSVLKKKQVYLYAKNLFVLLSPRVP